MMEDAATAEISRAQLWQWLRHGATVTMDDGSERLFTAEWLGELIQNEIVAILTRLGPNGFHRGHYASAARIVQEAVTAPTLPDFITTPAKDVLNALVTKHPDLDGVYATWSTPAESVLAALRNAGNTHSNSDRFCFRFVSMDRHRLMEWGKVPPGEAGDSYPAGLPYRMTWKGRTAGAGCPRPVSALRTHG